MEIYKTFDKPRVKADRLLPRIHTGAPAQAAGPTVAPGTAAAGRQPSEFSSSSCTLHGAQFEQTECTGPELFSADGQMNTSAVPKTSLCIFEQLL